MVAGGSSAEASSEAQQKESNHADSSSDSASGGGNPQPSDPAKADSGDGDGGGGKKSDKDANGSGHGEGGPDKPGGNGQSSGSNTPKKSRGVAPMMLGTPQPDLFQGKPLPGPDERTKREVPPQAMPGDVAPATPVAPRQGDEPPVPVYRVPPEMRRLVGGYFEKYHQSDVPPANTTR